MVTLHEPDFPSLKVTVLQTADGGNTQIIYFYRTKCQFENDNWGKVI